MPSPIAHSATGYVIFKIFKLEQKRILGKVSPVFEAITAIIISNVADLDFAFGFLSGENHHRGFTHSVSFALIFSIAIAFFSSKISRASLYKVFIFSSIIYGSHLLLDFFTTGGDGMLLLWPFSDNYYKSSFPIFPPVHHNLGLFAPIHIIFISFELTYVIAIYYVLDIWKKYYVKKNSQKRTKPKH